MAKRKQTAKKKAAAKTVGRRTPRSNGLTSFSMHSANKAGAAMIGAVDSELAAPRTGFAAAAPADLDPESAARRYLQQSLASKSVKSFTLPESLEPDTEFKTINTETIPLTGTVMVKFRQALNKIPIYGSLVTVELNKDNSLVNLSSAIGEPAGVSPVAKISPADAADAVKKYGDTKKDLSDAIPRLYFYYDQKGQRWRLVYVLEDVPVTLPRDPDAFRPRKMDYFVDAHTGSVVAEIPSSGHMAAVTETAKDGLGADRTITVERNSSRKVLQNLALNVQTFDFKFADPEAQSKRLPGSTITNPPAWTPTAVSAHANATVVAEFLRKVLSRNNINNQGGPMNSSINCVVVSASPGGRVWQNAFWDGTQMVYGQVQSNGDLLSISVDLDVVAHEMFHGVTNTTSDLQYQTQSGALNESYSDIFGVIVANFVEPDTAKWSWKLGDHLGDNGGPFRDMSNPTAYGQPAHMKNFRVLPVTRNGDYGGVHINSGIHNFAAFKILTARDSSGQPVITPTQAIQIFYLADTQHLAPTSQFADSRRAVQDSALSLFQGLPVAERRAKLGAIDDAFNAVGIPGQRVVV